MPHPSPADRIDSGSAQPTGDLPSPHIEFARKGKCIVLGRGGQTLLAGLPGILHVRIIAPQEVRKERIMKRYECDERHAERVIQHSDHERAGFHKFFFDLHWEDPHLYDLVVNTGFFSVDSAARLIEGVVYTDEFKAEQEETNIKLVAVVDEQNFGQRFMSCNVEHPDRLNAMAFDKILITSFNSTELILQKIADLGIPEESVVQLS